MNTSTQGTTRLVPTPEADWSGTSRIGTLTTTYKHLVELFGAPHYTLADSIDGKVSAEWVLTLEPSGAVFTIYDYKLYDYGYGIDDISEYPELMFGFSIGGYPDLASVNVVIQQLVLGDTQND